MAPINQKRNIKTKQIEDKLNSSLTKNFFKLEDESAIGQHNSNESNAIIHDIRSILSNNTSGWRKQESRDALIVAAAKLRKLNRSSNFRNRIESGKLNEKRRKVEEQYLSLQNITNEIAHLRKNIETCLEFQPADADIELINVEEFNATLKNQQDEIKADPHQLHLARLNNELNERKSMLANLHELEGRKSALLSDIRGKEQRLCQIQPKIGAIKKTTHPLLDLLGIKSSKEKIAIASNKTTKSRILELNRIFINEEVCREIFGTHSIEIGSDTRVVEIIEEKMETTDQEQINNNQCLNIEENANGEAPLATANLKNFIDAENGLCSTQPEEYYENAMQIISTIRSAINSSNEPSNSIDEILQNAINLRRLNRKLQIKNYFDRDKFNQKRSKIENRITKLKTIENKIKYLRNAVEICLEYESSLDSEIDLIPVEQFCKELPIQLNIARIDPHQLHLARLKNELANRKSLLEKVQELEREKKKLHSTIGTMERTLNKVDPRVENLKKIAKPLLDIVGLKSVSLSVHNKEIPFRPLEIDAEIYKEIYGGKSKNGGERGQKMENVEEMEEIDEGEKEIEMFLVHRLRQIPSIRRIHIHRKEQFRPTEYSQKYIAKNEINILAAANEIKNGRQNATMILLVDLPKDGTSILFTHRAAKMKNHANEISLPGGAMEQGESIEIAALRETEEEIGLDRREMEIWGQLPSIPMPKNEGKTTPILCRFIGDPASFESKLRPQANEVQGIFLVPIDELIKNIHFTAFRVPGRFKHGLPMYYKMPAFIVNEFKVLCPSQNEKYLPNRRRIWGLTAICVHEMLLSILSLKDKIKQK